MKLNIYIIGLALALPGFALVGCNNDANGHSATKAAKANSVIETTPINPLTFFANNSEKARFGEFKALAEQGSGYGLSYLASSYRHGSGVKEDDSLASQYEKQAAGIGYYRSHSVIMRQYNLKAYKAKDPEEKAKYKALSDQHMKLYHAALKDAVDAGDPYAMMELGRLQLNDIYPDLYDLAGAAANFEQMANIVREHADSGSAQAQFSLGVLYMQGTQPFLKDLDKAEHWLTLAGNNGVGKAYMALCKVRELRGIHDMPCVDLWSKAADLGLDSAFYSLHTHYIRLINDDESNDSKQDYLTLALNNAKAYYEQNPDAASHVAEVYWKMGSTNEKIAWEIKVAQEANSKITLISSIESIDWYIESTYREKGLYDQLLAGDIDVSSDETITKFIAAIKQNSEYCYDSDDPFSFSCKISRLEKKYANIM